MARPADRDVFLFRKNNKASPFQTRTHIHCKKEGEGTLTSRFSASTINIGTSDLIDVVLNQGNPSVCFPLSRSPLSIILTSIGVSQPPEADKGTRTQRADSFVIIADGIRDDYNRFFFYQHQGLFLCSLEH